MADLSELLAKLKSLRSAFGGFGSKLNSIDDCIGKMASQVAALESTMSEVKQNVPFNITRLEVENRNGLEGERLGKKKSDLASAMKRIKHR